MLKILKEYGFIIVMSILTALTAYNVINLEKNYKFIIETENTSVLSEITEVSNTSLKRTAINQYEIEHRLTKFQADRFLNFLRSKNVKVIQVK